MKLNFWQILGAVLIVIGLIFVIRKQMANEAPAPQTPVMKPTTQSVSP